MQDLNQGVLAEGKRKVEVLRATKDFKKGIYGLQWEHTRSSMQVLPPRLVIARSAMHAVRCHAHAAHHSAPFHLLPA